MLAQRHREARGRTSAVVETTVPEVALEIPGGARIVSAAAPVPSIRIPETSGRMRCGLCERRFLAAGPTGHVDEDAICDLCMLERDPQLGLVLVLVAVTRSYGRGWPIDEVEEENARLELMAFARIYEAQASHYAPARPVDPDWLEPITRAGGEM